MRSRNSSLISSLLVIGTVFAQVALLNSASSQEKPVYKATGSEGAVIGTISFAGQPPKPRRIDTSADPVCEKVNPDLTTDWVIVTDQKLANVVVYLRSESLNLYSFEAPTPYVMLEHKDCRYEPHVMGMQTQQTVKVINSDPTTHNTHPTPKNNAEWNQSQAPGAAAIEQRFAWPELFIPIKDNQHPWEKAYVGVFSHPFFAVSSATGTYKISGVPPGQYMVVAWHERLGEQTVDVFVAGSEQRTLDFTFKASEH
ncbi:MAG TPA: carboxypeptidase regulatory-like domain-containing protein [Pyrinomonadaceae bacterium]|nr:carboxypeptidase regulatory-like domain-containing protein [Pyrinomonadaceae bacterium]